MQKIKKPVSTIKGKAVKPRINTEFNRFFDNAGDRNRTGTGG